jgi:hypothetical protein
MTDELRIEADDTAKAISLPLPDTLRKALEYGLPVVKKKFRKKK